MDDFKPIVLSDAPNIEQSYLVESLVPKGLITIIYGQGGTLKSYISLYLGYCVANGLPFLGFPVESTNVLYLDYELSAAQHAIRLSKFGNSIIKENSNNVYYQQTKTPLIELDKLQEFVKTHNIGLIIIDSFGAAMGKDVSSTPKALQCFKYLNSLGVTIFILDHCAKAGKTVYGSAYKFNEARSVIHAEMKERGEGFSIIGLEHTKHSTGAPIENLGVKVSFGQDNISFKREQVGLTMQDIEDATSNDVEKRKRFWL